MSFLLCNLLYLLVTDAYCCSNFPYRQKEGWIFSQTEQHTLSHFLVFCEKGGKMVVLCCHCCELSYLLLHSLLCGYKGLSLRSENIKQPGKWAGGSGCSAYIVTINPVICQFCFCEARSPVLLSDFWDALTDCFFHYQPCLHYVLFFLMRFMVTLFQLRYSQIWLNHCMLMLVWTPKEKCFRARGSLHLWQPGQTPGMFHSVWRLKTCTVGKEI